MVHAMELSHQVGKLQRSFRPHGKGVLCYVLFNSAQGQGGGVGQLFHLEIFHVEVHGPEPDAPVDRFTFQAETRETY